MKASICVGMWRVEQARKPERRLTELGVPEDALEVELLERLAVHGRRRGGYMRVATVERQGRAGEQMRRQLAVDERTVCAAGASPGPGTATAAAGGLAAAAVPARRCRTRRRALCARPLGARRAGRLRAIWQQRWRARAGLGGAWPGLGRLRGGRLLWPHGLGGEGGPGGDGRPAGCVGGVLWARRVLLDGRVGGQGGVFGDLHAVVVVACDELALSDLGDLVVGGEVMHLATCWGVNYPRGQGGKGKGGEAIRSPKPMASACFLCGSLPAASPRPVAKNQFPQTAEPDHAPTAPLALLYPNDKTLFRYHVHHSSQ